LRNAEKLLRCNLQNVPHVKFRKIHLFKILQSAFRKVHLPCTHGPYAVTKWYLPCANCIRYDGIFYQLLLQH